MQAGIDGGFQQRTARRPNNTATFVVRSVNLILQGSLSQQVSSPFVCVVDILRLIGSASFLGQSFSNYPRLVRLISATHKNWDTSQMYVPQYIVNVLLLALL